MGQKISNDWNVRFSAMFSGEPDCVKIMDHKGVVLQMNPAGLTILEAQHSKQVVGHSMFDFIVPEHHDPARECFSKVLSSGPYTCRFDVTTLRGKRRHVESRMIPLRDLSDHIEVLGVTRDITDLLAAEAALRESEARFQLLVDISGEMVSELTPTGHLVYISPNLKTILGYEPADLIGKSMFDFLHPEEQSAIVRLFELNEAAATYRFPHKNGSVRWLESTGRRYSTAGGEPRIVVVTRDVTSRREAHAARVSREAKLRQAQKMESLGILAGGIAHDFNNILSVIIGNIEIARMEIDQEGPATDALKQAVAAVSRATDLVRQILSFSRRNDQERKLIEVAQVVADSVKLLRAALPKNIQIQTRIQPDLPTVSADPSEIFQVIMNLATNASHAMKDRRGILEIDLDRESITEAQLAEYPGLQAGDFVKLTFKDSGVGMHPEILDRIFEPFFTTKPSGEGTGLGLSVVHGIIKSHDGAIYVESELGLGTKFEVFLPAAGGQTPCDAPLAHGSGQIILFVDDDNGVCKMAEDVLRRAGYSPHAFTSAPDALSEFATNPSAFHLVITDVSMPQMSGLTLAGEIKRLSPNTPVILMTGFPGAIQQTKLHSLGADLSLSKPLTARALCESIQSVMAKAQRT